jgi:hypothetical protein
MRGEMRFHQRPGFQTARNSDVASNLDGLAVYGHHAAHDDKCARGAAEPRRRCDVLDHWYSRIEPLGTGWSSVSSAQRIGAHPRRALDRAAAECSALLGRRPPSSTRSYAFFIVNERQSTSHFVHHPTIYIDKTEAHGRFEPPEDD